MFRIVIAFVEHLPENIKLQVYTALLPAPLFALQYYSPRGTSAKPYKTTRLFVGHLAGAMSKNKVCEGAEMPRGPFLQAAAGRPPFWT